MAIIVDFVVWRPKRKALQNQREEETKTPVQGTADFSDLRQNTPGGLPAFTGLAPASPRSSESMANM